MSSPLSAVLLNRAARAAASGALHLPDTSEWQGSMNAGVLVKQNGGAAIIRAHTGYRADVFYAARRQQLEQAGCRVLGFYGYVTPFRDITTQANEFCDIVGFLKPGQFAMLDIEDPGYSGDVSGIANAWFAVVDRRLGYSGYNGSWGYSYASFIVLRGLMPIWDSTRHTVTAAYSSVEPASPPHSLWQHTDNETFWITSGAVGNTGGCDCNIFDGTLDALYAKVCSTPTPVPPKPPAPPVNRFAGYRTIQKGWRDPITGPLPQHVAYNPKDYPAHVLQYTINAITGNPNRLTWDGIYGAATEDNVAEFQRLMHLSVDGVCGPQTWAALSAVCAFKGL